MTDVFPTRERLFENRYLLFYFLVATGLMFYQHSLGWNWDFVVYSLNGQYFFHDGVYMEWLRPPLVPTLLGLLQFVFPVRTAEYVFVGLSSLTFLYSCLRLCRQYEIPTTPFYVFVLSPFVIFYAALNGTELLYMSFVALYLTDFRSSKTGLWMGLAFLTRYSGGILIPLVLFQRETDILVIDTKVAKTLSLAFAVVLPWFVVNVVVLGHPLASVADFYALNVAERGASSPFHLVDVVAISGISLVFTAYYLREWLGNLRERSDDLADWRHELRRWIRDSDNAVFSVLGVMVVLRQFNIMIAERRFLIEFAIIAAFFGVKGWQRASRADIGFGATERRLFFAGIAVVYLVAGGYLVSTTSMVDPAPYHEASEEVGDCLSISNEWVYLAYAGTPAGPGDFQSNEEFLDDGYKVVTFTSTGYDVQGEGCQEGPYNTTYVERLERVYGETRYCSYVPIETCEFERILSADDTTER